MVLPTRLTTIEVSSQGHIPPMKAYRVDSDEACNDRIPQFMTDDCVSICVSIKNLPKKKKGVTLVLLRALDRCWMNYFQYFCFGLI